MQRVLNAGLAYLKASWNLFPVEQKQIFWFEDSVVWGKYVQEVKNTVERNLDEPNENK